MDKVISYIKSQIALCIEQTGMEPDALDLRYLIDSEEFRELYESNTHRMLAHGSEGVAQVLLDCIKSL